MLNYQRVNIIRRTGNLFDRSAAWDIPKRADRVVLADLWRALDFRVPTIDPFPQWFIDIQQTYIWPTNDLPQDKVG